MRDVDLSFTELFNAATDGNHGKFGYHLRELKGFVELEPSTRKYRLTDAGKLLDACIRDFRFITSVGKRLYDMNKLDTPQSIQLCNCHGHLISKGVIGKTIV